MKLFAALFIFFSISITSGAAQEKCDLENAPPLFNLNLGMSSEQAQAALGKSLKIKIKKNSQRSFFENFINKSAPDTLAGVRAIYLRFLDDRLYQIEIFYEEKSEWRTLEDFIENFSEKNGIQVSDWKIEYGIAELNCGEFSITTDKVLNPRVQLTDEILGAKVEELRKQKDNK